jgi:hypothetical protein
MDKVQKHNSFKNMVILLAKGAGDSSVVYGLNDRGFESRQGLKIFLITASRLALSPTQPPIQRIPGTLSRGAKWPGRKADHLLPFSAEVKNARSYTSTLPIRLHGVVLCYKHRDNFNFYLYIYS